MRTNQFILSMVSLTLPFTLRPVLASPEFRFHSPTRNIYCAMTTDSVSCDVSKHAWKLWACSDSGCYGHRFTLPANGPAYAQRSSDSMVGFTATTLFHGFQLSNTRLSCKSELEGIICTNQYGGRMKLTADSYELKGGVRSVWR
jgi:hypothetical protein